MNEFRKLMEALDHISNEMLSPREELLAKIQDKIDQINAMADENDALIKSGKKILRRRKDEPLTRPEARPYYGDGLKK
jgi:hypothetical protein